MPSLQSFCPILGVPRRGFVTRLPRAALTESYNSRASQHQRNSKPRGLKTFKTLVLYIFLSICKSITDLSCPRGLSTRPQCWGPQEFLGKSPWAARATSEPSHWEGTPGKSLESSLWAEFLNFKEFPLLPRQWDWGWRDEIWFFLRGFCRFPSAFLCPPLKPRRNWDLSSTLLS